MTNEPMVVVQGRQWFLYSAAFESEGSRFSFYFYAMSDEHAAVMLGAIKSTATIEGCVVSLIDGGEDTRPDELVH